jgi:hypothetical protein
MKRAGENKALDPRKAEADRERMIEGRDAGPGEAEYNFPHDGITVVASSTEEAERKRAEILKNRGIQNKGESSTPESSTSDE